MANSKRKRIIDYIRDTALARITVAGGYNYTIVTKQRGIKEPDALPDSSLPAVFIAQTKEDRENITSIQFKSVLTVVLLGMVTNSAGTTGAQGNIDDFIEDITKALETDRLCGGLTHALEVKRVATDEGDEDLRPMCSVTVELSYASDGTTP